MPQTYALQTVEDVQPLVPLIEKARQKGLGFNSEAAKKFCTDLSHCLLSDNRTSGSNALQALGFWLRPASLDPIVKTFATTPEGTMRVPRGVVFQMPPANIETLFGYNAALSLLCGNVTLVRLPSETKAEQDILLTLIEESLATVAPSLSNHLLFVRYGHDDSITASLSALCDLRMVWGGDDTVEAIRHIPLPPRAREISFANRFSMAAIKAEGFLQATAEEQEKAVRDFANDTYQFGQMACASPRLLCWIGNKEDAEKAATLFYPALAAAAKAKFGQINIGENIAKLNAQFLALHDLPIEKSERYGATLTVLTFTDWTGLSSFKSIDYGHGMLLETRLSSLSELATKAEGKDQTLALWGFNKEDAAAFGKHCAGRGFDRLTRFGDALAFDVVWDGTNLFDLLTKFVLVKLAN